MALDIYCDLKFLWLSENEHCREKPNAAATRSGNTQQTMKPSTRAQSWAIVGTRKDFWPFFVSKVFKKSRRSEVYLDKSIRT